MSGVMTCTTCAHRGLGVHAAGVLRHGEHGVVAAARELTELVFYGLRDGQIRRPSAPCSPRRGTPAAWSLSSGLCK